MADTPPMSLDQALAEWERRLGDRQDDPELRAGCERIGRLLAGTTPPAEEPKERDTP